MTFELENQSYTPVSPLIDAQSGSAMERWLIKKGIAKDGQVASFVLYGIIVVSFVTIVIIFMYSSRQNIPQSPLSPEEQQRENEAYINSMKGV